MSHEPVASAASAPSLQPEVGRAVIEPLPAPLRGAATVPGDKSISHRAVLFAAMAEGTSRVSGVLDSEDVRSSIKAVSQLGARVSLERQPDGSLAAQAGRSHRLRQLRDHGAPAHGRARAVGRAR